MIEPMKFIPMGGHPHACQKCNYTWRSNKINPAKCDYCGTKNWDKRKSPVTRKLPREAKKRTPAQTLLGIHLEDLGFGPVIFEFPFAQGRRFRADVAIPSESLLFECDGHFQGKHGTGWGAGHEKINLAQALGFRCFQFSNRDILTGKALAWLKEHLILCHAK